MDKTQAHELEGTKATVTARMEARTPPSPMSQCLARVRAISEDGVLVDDGGVTRLVRQATSCLIEPELGDLVLLAVPANDPGGYLLAVLERESTKTTLVAPGDLVITAPRGRVSVAASEGLELATPKQLGVRADELQVQARSGRMFLDECAAVVRSMFASLTKLTHVGEVLELLVDRVTQRSKHSIRAIEGLDHTQAENLDFKVENNVHVRATRTVVNGTEVVKVDGKQIHLG
jgi:hypothetical protein